MTKLIQGSIQIASIAQIVPANYAVLKRSSVALPTTTDEEYNSFKFVATAFLKNPSEQNFNKFPTYRMYHPYIGQKGTLCYMHPFASSLFGGSFWGLIGNNAAQRCCDILGSRPIES
jgi:hypothetical protein